MSDEIVEFLRRAAQRQKPPHEPIVDADVVEDAEILEADVVPGEDVAQHVARRLDTSNIGQRATQLGVNVDQSDDIMEAHLHQVFEHQLGDLGARTSRAAVSILDDDDRQSTRPPSTPAPTTAIAISEMLRSPQDLRNAIVLSEILRRPDERW